MNNKALLEKLVAINACHDSVEWVGQRTAKQAWLECDKPEWLFWIAGRTGVDRKKIVSAACGCARLALKFCKKGENRPRLAIEAAEGWTQGNVTLSKVREAREDAWAARNAAAAAYAAAAAAAAATADATAYAAAADAAAYAAAAADAAAAYAARKKMQLDCCKAIRKAIQFKDLKPSPK